MTTPSDLSYLFAQFNVRVGDIARNCDNIVQTIEEAQENQIDIVIFPELALTGYPPRDFLHFTSFHIQIEDALDRILEATTSCHIILGVPLYDNKNRLRNSAVVINKTGIIYTYYKTLLPDYDVFDESRYFYPNDDPGVVDILGIRMGVQICEDAWDYMWMHPTKVTEVQKSKGAKLIINISASPYTMTKPSNRLNLIKEHVNSIGIPFIYVNLVGSQDDLVFDGRSFVVNNEGSLVYATPSFTEGKFRFDGKILTDEVTEVRYEANTWMEEVIDAISNNLADYLMKSYLPGSVLIALSGGIDSALTVTLATYTLGNTNVTAVYLPTKFSQEQSYQDSKQLCDNLGIKLITLEIEEIRQLFDSKFDQIDLIQDGWGLADENIQARIRANVMMYLSNKLGHILVSTGNKSEIATGYCTLYGDTAGGKNLIGDLYKTQVYELAKFINREKEIIPKSIIQRPPSAELRVEQKDEDSLPPYDVLDGILELFVDNYQSEEEIVNAGYDRQKVREVINLVLRNEFKRYQMVQTVKVSDKAFGAGWRIPLATNFNP